MKNKSLIFVLLLLIMLILTWNLSARSVMNLTSLHKFRIIVINDSIDIGFLADYSRLQHQIENPLFLVSMNVTMGLPLSSYEYKGIGSDMFEITGDFFKKYFSQKITVFSFYDLGFVYLSVKDSQSSQGFLQFMVPFGNLRYLLNSKKWEK